MVNTEYLRSIARLMLENNYVFASQTTGEAADELDALRKMAETQAAEIEELKRHAERVESARDQYRSLCGQQEGVITELQRVVKELRAERDTIREIVESQAAGMMVRGNRTTDNDQNLEV